MGQAGLGATRSKKRSQLVADRSTKIRPVCFVNSIISNSSPRNNGLGFLFSKNKSKKKKPTPFVFVIENERMFRWGFFLTKEDKTMQLKDVCRISFSTILILA